MVNLTSYKNLEVKLYCPNTPVILLVTKSDLKIDKSIVDDLKIKGMIPWSKVDELNLDEKIDAVKYMECCALKKEGVKDIFDQAIISVF